LEGKIRILLGRLWPFNKIARFLVFEVIAILISLFIFIFLDAVFIYIILYWIPKGPNPPPYIEGDSIGLGLGLAGVVIVAMYASLACSIPLGIAVHAYVFKKFFIRREKKR
jgi:hypothetical protein